MHLCRSALDISTTVVQQCRPRASRTITFHLILSILVSPSPTSDQRRGSSYSHPQTYVYIRVKYIHVPFHSRHEVTSDCDTMPDADSIVRKRMVVKVSTKKKKKVPCFGKTAEKNFYGLSNPLGNPAHVHNLVAMTNQTLPVCTNIEILIKQSSRFVCSLPFTSLTQKAGPFRLDITGWKYVV